MSYTLDANMIIALMKNDEKVILKIGAVNLKNHVSVLLVSQYSSISPITLSVFWSTISEISLKSWKSS